MVNRNLIRNLENDDALTAEIEAAMAGADATGLATLEDGADVDLNKIVEGRVIRITDGNVLVDVGFKSEGVISLDEWDETEEQPVEGSTFQVLVEDLEDNMGRACLLYTSPSPRDLSTSRMPSSA